MAEDWTAAPGCDQFTGKDPWQPDNPLDCTKQPRERVPVLGEKWDDYGNITETNPVNELLNPDGWVNCPKCSNTYHLSNLPHDCERAALLDLLRAMARDIDETYDEHSEMFGKHDEWLTMMGRALAAHLADHTQVELVFNDELAQQAFGKLVVQCTEAEHRALRAEARADEVQKLLLPAQSKIGKLETENTAAKLLANKQTDQIAALGENLTKLLEQIQDLRSEAASLSERIEEAEGGLFG